jgi:hypothetical protein
VGFTILQGFYQYTALVRVQKFFYISPVALKQDWLNVSRTRAQIVYEFRRNFSRAQGNFEEQNKVLECSIIIISYCTINAYHIYIINN